MEEASTTWSGAADVQGPSASWDQPSAPEAGWQQPAAPQEKWEPSTTTSSWSEEAPTRPTPWRLLQHVAALVIFAGVAVRIAALFPHFSAGAGALAGRPDQATLEAILAASWVVAGLGVLARSRTGVGFAAALAVSELGFRLADVGQVISGGIRAGGPGLWLLVAAWAVSSVGAVLACVAIRGLGRLGGRAWTLPILITIASILAAVAFLPSWDSYTFVATAVGRGGHFTAGNAFSNPQAVAAGDVVAAVAIALLPAVAAWWHSARVGAAAIAGVVAVLGAELVAAIVQVSQPAPSSLVGVSPALASRIGLKITASLTGWFDLDVIAVFALAVLAAALAVDSGRFVARDPLTGNGMPAQGAAPDPWAPPAQGAAPDPWAPPAQGAAPDPWAPPPPPASAPSPAGQWPPPPASPPAESPAWPANAPPERAQASAADLDPGHG